MRRGSIIAPLILILIGIVFLIKNIRPDIPLFEMIFTYWPFLLIAWGLLRMVEVTATYLRGSPLPSAGVTGGEWALVIVLTMIGSMAWGVQRFNRDGGFGKIRIGGVEVFGESYDYPLETVSKKSGKAPRIVVENLRGATRIIGSDTEEVKVSGRRTVRAMDRATADRAHGESPFEFNVVGDVVTIRTGIERGEASRLSSDLEIAVPKGASIEARGRRVDFDVSDVNGDVMIDSDNSGVRLQNIGGRVRVDLRASDIIRAFDVKGDVELKGRGRDIELENIAGQVTIDGGYSGETILRKVAKPVRFESSVTRLQVGQIPGELEISLSTISGTNVTGPVSVNAKSKDIDLADVTERIDVEVDRGDVTIRQSKLPLPALNVRSESGKIDLALPAGAKFTLNAEVRRGTVSNDFDPKLTETATDRGAKLTGDLGGGPTIKATTDRGELTIRKIAPGEVTVVEPAAPKKGHAPPPPPKAPERAVNQ